MRGSACARVDVMVRSWVLAMMVMLHWTLAMEEDAMTPWTNAQGLRFTSQEAFCRYHCRATHVHIAYRNAGANECSRLLCGSYLEAYPHARRFLEETEQSVMERSTGEEARRKNAVSATFLDLQENMEQEDEKAIARINVVSCRNHLQSSKGEMTEQLVSQVELAIGRDGMDQQVFQGFSEAFFQAYEAMLGSVNASYDACQMQAVQETFLQNQTTSDKHQEPTTASAPDEPQVHAPMLIKLEPTANQATCIQKVRSIWTPENEYFTPFLTRRDERDANSTVATIMLMHIPSAIADRLLELECVKSIVQLPAILKLTPFARSSVALARSSTRQGGPPLQVYLVPTANSSVALARLQEKIQARTGIQNLLHVRQDSSHQLVLEAVEEFETWTTVTAALVDDSAVEWVDLRTEITTGALKPNASLEQRLLEEHNELSMAEVAASASVSLRQSADALSSPRRLDDYIQDLIGVEEARSRGILGEGIIVGVTDTGLYVDHDQFDQKSRSIYDEVDLNARKVVLYRAFANMVDESEHVVCGHGTHVAGILAGSSNSRQSKDLGIASSARIAFMDIGKQSVSCQGQKGCEVSLETPGDVEMLMRDQMAVNAKIFSFSWGTAGSDYSTQARDLDNFIFNNPEVLIIVAAGNSGGEGAQTISSPSGAKNVISVGASLNHETTFAKSPCTKVLNERTVATFSSAGPTFDGRQKPDIVAPGMVIQSAQSEAPGSTTKSSAMCGLQGTSQSTPAVAGMAVLLYEWLRDGWWHQGEKNSSYGLQYIPAALLKALIIHSGTPMEHRLVAPRNGVTSCVAMEEKAIKLKSYPDFNQGYGKPSMKNLMSFGGDDEEAVYFYPNHTQDSEPVVKDGEEVHFHFVLVEDTTLRITLVWTDPAGSLASRTTLQNDLDLFVRLPTVAHHRFFPLSGNGARDDKNNVEMVQVSYSDILKVAKENQVTVGPDGGIEVEAVVHGFNVKANGVSRQPFALVASSSPVLVETRAEGPSDESFWRPWMTVAVIVVGTVMCLVLIALVWRVRTDEAALADLKGDVPASAGVYEDRRVV